MLEPSEPPRSLFHDVGIPDKPWALPLGGGAPRDTTPGGATTPGALSSASAKRILVWRRPGRGPTEGPCPKCSGERTSERVFRSRARNRGSTKIAQQAERVGRVGGSMWLHLLLLLVLLPIPEASAQNQGNSPRVEAILWTGTQDVPPSDLEPYLLTRARPWWQPLAKQPLFDPAALDTDMDRIATLYRDHGYYAARASYTLDWNPQHDAVRIQIAVEEGLPTRLSSWGVDLSEMPGGEAAWRKELLDGLPLQAGDVFTIKRYGAAKELLLSRLADRGFPDATLSGGGDVDASQATATVWWRVHPGARVVVGDIRIEGLSSVSEELVRRELKFHSGDLYSGQALERTQRALYELGLFLWVTVAPVTDESGSGKDQGSSLSPEIELVRPILITVRERKPRSVRLGVGYGTEDSLRLQAGWIDRNFLGRADPLEVRTQYSSLASTAQITLREPHWPDTDTVTLLTVKLTNETPPAYDARTASARIGLERVLAEHWKGRLAYNLAWSSVHDVPFITQELLSNPARRYLLSFFELGVRRDTTDDPLDPTRGTWLDFSIEPAAEALGSQLDYVKYLLEGRAFVPIGPTVLASRMRIGTMVPFGNTSAADLPVTELFYSGGSDSVRGYGYQKLGPIGAEGEAVGGASLLEGSVELRFPIWSALRGVVFVDAGQLSLQAWEWRPASLLYASGLGLRYKTPLGPIRFDVGVPLNPPNGGVQSYRLWFSIGQAF